MSTYHYEIRRDGGIACWGAGAEEAVVAHLSINWDLLSRQAAQPLLAPAPDLVRVAGAVHATDRLSPGHGPKTRGVQREIGWPRELHLRVAVDDPGRWNSRAGELTRVLGMLTDDRWSFEFTADGPRSPLPRNMLPQEVPPEVEVALFSGGLDSLAGLLLSGHPVVPVCACADGMAQSVQTRLLRAGRELGLVPFWVQGWAQLQRKAPGRRPPEPTLRSRAFFFWALGAAVAAMLGRSRVSSFEPGPGALNLPLCEAQVGAQNTRAMHPALLAPLERLVSELPEWDVSFELPHFDKTKGELFQAVDSRLGPLVAKSFSCDEGARNGHCGVCTSCVMRRIGLHASGIEDTTEYRDLDRSSHGLFDLDVVQLHALRVRQHGATFEGLLGMEPFLRHAEAYFVRRGVSAGAFRATVVAVMQRHAAEVLAWYEAARPAVRREVPAPHKEADDHDLFGAAGAAHR